MATFEKGRITDTFYFFLWFFAADETVRALGAVSFNHPLYCMPVCLYSESAARKAKDRQTTAVFYPSCDLQFRFGRNTATNNEFM